MGFDDFSDSAPSAIGFALTAAACFKIPTAIPLAAMLGTVVSDPAQIWHVGTRHAHLAETADSAKAQLIQAVDQRASAGNWEGTDKNAFVKNHVEPYLAALDQTVQMHNGVNSSMGTLAKVYLGAGALSLTIGGIMAVCAAAIAGLSWVPGANLVAEAAGISAAQASSSAFRQVLLKLAGVIWKAKDLLKSIKGLLALAAADFFGMKAVKTGLDGATAMPTFWPGVSQPGGQAPAPA